MHLSVALVHEGARVAVLDLDRRQQSMAHFFGLGPRPVDFDPDHRQLID